MFTTKPATTTYFRRASHDSTQMILTQTDTHCMTASATAAIRTGSILAGMIDDLRVSTSPIDCRLILSETVKHRTFDFKLGGTCVRHCHKISIALTSR